MQRQLRHQRLSDGRTPVGTVGFVLLVALLATGGLLANAEPVYAHGNRPLAEDLYAVGEDGASWFLRTNFGAITSEAPRRYVCEEAFTSAESFRFLPVAPETWLAASDGTLVRTEGGCNFTEVASFEGSVAATAVDPETGRVAVATPGRDGAQLHISIDGGRNFAAADLDFESTPGSWSGLAFASATELVATTTASSDSDSARLIRLSVPADAADAAATAEGTEIAGSTPLDGTFPELLLVEGDRVVWTASGSEQDSGEDANSVAFGPLDAPAEHRFDVAVRPADAALDPDSGQLWIASAWESDNEGSGRGFARVDPDADSPSLERVLADHSASCVERVGDALYVCGHRLRDGYDLGRVTSHDENHEVEQTLHFQNLRGPLSCPDDSDTGSVCPALWSEIAESLDIDPDSGSGPDTGGDAGRALADPAPQPETTCSAASPTIGAESLPLDWALLVLGLAWLVWGRESSTISPEGRDDV